MATFLGNGKNGQCQRIRFQQGFHQRSQRKGHPVSAARERVHAGGVIGKSLTGRTGHNYRAEQTHRHKCAACPGLTGARDRCFPYLSPMNIPPFINRVPNKSPAGSAVATSNYSLTCYLQPIWETQPLF